MTMNTTPDAPTEEMIFKAAWEHKQDAEYQSNDSVVDGYLVVIEDLAKKMGWEEHLDAIEDIVWSYDNEIEYGCYMTSGGDGSILEISRPTLFRKMVMGAVTASPTVKGTTEVVRQTRYTREEARQAHRDIDAKVADGSMTTRSAAAYKAHVSRRIVAGEVA